jgi:cytochrome oxidase Cu insertion factor (SCO1/SenC/PrrC family)
MAAEVIMNRPWTRSLFGSLAALALVASGCGKKDSKDSEPQPEPAQATEQGHDSPLLAVGADAPDFTAQAHDGTTVSLGALEGQPVVLYFYPKDATPG